MESIGSTRATCSVCSNPFDVTFRYQVRTEGTGTHFFCSQHCHQEALKAPEASRCSACDRSFVVEYPYQVEATDGRVRYFCSSVCRTEGDRTDDGTIKTTRIAVFNHKGGTGKTTTAVNLAAGFAEAGKRVLLIDADGQGNVGASLGIRGEFTLYHILVQGRALEEVAVPVRTNMDVVTANEALAAAELHLAARPNRDRILRERLGNYGSEYDVVIVDCAPALSLMNQNALMYVDGVIVPVSCDYLSLVGVKQVLKTMKNVRELLKHDLELLGVLPTFYDVRNKICREAVDTLTDHFAERCLPPIRVNTKLREAPSQRQTIFEYAPESHGALDYQRLVECVLINAHSEEPVTSEMVMAEVPSHAAVEVSAR